MAHREVGPHRSGSIDAYLLGTRILGAVAALALAGGILSDLLDGSFWRNHALLAGLASSVLVVMLSAGIFNEALERRRRRRWSVLAQYVMLDLVRSARLFWTSILEMSGLLPADTPPASLVEIGAPMVRDRARLSAALAGLISDRRRRQALHDKIALSVSRSEEMLGRWAAVMLNADLYAEIIDRHVELATSMAWLSNILDSSLPPEDDRRRHLARASAAVQVEGEISDELLIERLAEIAHLAEELDRGTLELAFRIVPPEWWQSRLGTAAAPILRVPAGATSARVVTGPAVVRGTTTGAEGHRLRPGQSGARGLLRLPQRPPGRSQP